MSTPEPRQYKTVMTVATACLEQRVEVYAHPHVRPVPYQGAAGTIKALSGPPDFRAVAGVRLDGYGSSLVWIPLHQLHPTD